MPPRAVAAAAACAALALAGCGSSEEFSEGRVLKAADVNGGAVGGDPFCRVDQALGSAEAIEAAGADGNLITSKRGNVGVVVVPPFPDDCAEAVRKGLDRLDREPE